jgi:DNA mismatch repair protein MutL
MVALDLEIDPERVDVNVSPTKSEVKFEHEGTAFEGLRYAIRQSLLDHGMMPSAFGIAQKSIGTSSGTGVHSGLANEVRGPFAEGTAREGDSGVRLVREVDRDDFAGAGVTGLLDRPQGAFGSVDGALIGEVGTQASTGLEREFSRESLGAIPGGEGGHGVPGSATGSGVYGSGVYGSGVTESSAVTERLLDIPKGGLDPFSVPRTSAMPYVHLLDDLRIIGQAQNTFILAETRHGIVVVDQHVAHERILYEYLCGLKRSTLVEKQPLLVPQTLEVDRRAAILLMEKIGELEQVGYELEPFGGDAFVVRAAPAALRGKDPIRVLRDLVDELIDSTVTKKLVPTREAIWIMSACKMAVKAGDPLSHAEMEKLLVDLATTENPYHCPHGRPITATLTTQELLKLFKRV